MGAEIRRMRNVSLKHIDNVVMDVTRHSVSWMALDRRCIQGASPAA